MQKSRAPKKPMRFTRPGESNFQPKGKTVYVGNLNYKVSKKDLFGIFAKFGKVKTVNLITEPGSEKSKGIAFVRMEKGKDADKAIAYLDGRIVDGRTLKASEAQETDYTRKPKPFTTKRSKVDLGTEKKEARARKQKRGLNELKDFLASK